MNINNLGSGGLKDTNHHLVYTADPAWTNYFPGTTTNFFMTDPTAQIPAVWTFNLRIHTKYAAGSIFPEDKDGRIRFESQTVVQQEDFYLQVVAPEAYLLNR